MNLYDPQKYWEDRLKSRYDLTGVGNIVFDKKYNEYLYKLQLSVLKKALKKYKISLHGKTVLDIGCGTGFFSAFYHKSLAQITGIDITTTSIESLRKSFPDGKFITMDISAELTANKEYFENRFDLVNMLNVIFHIVDDAKFERALENLADMLKRRRVLIHFGLFRRDGSFSRTTRKIQDTRKVSDPATKRSKYFRDHPDLLFNE